MKKPSVKHVSKHLINKHRYRIVFAGGTLGDVYLSKNNEWFADRGGIPYGPYPDQERAIEFLISMW